MSDRRRSVLFVIADDWSRLARCYGNEVIRTPHIDALAERGTVFDYAFCTSPSCAVSRACILTGQHSHTHGQYGHCHGIHGFRTHEYMQSTPAVLQAHGYATGCIGKKHVEPASVYPFAYEPGVDARSPDGMASKVTEFLSEHAEQPFYLHIGSEYPHRAGRGFGNERMHAGITPTPYDPEEVIVPGFLPDVPRVRRDLAEYYESVSRYDQVVGAVVAALEASGRAEETLIFVTTDHAMPFPGAKASSFDSGHRCPLIICHPEQRRRGIHSQALMLGRRPRAGFLRQDREALFDMESDPDETRNLIAEPALAEAAAEMRAKVVAFRRATRDPWLEVSFQEGELDAYRDS